MLTGPSRPLSWVPDEIIVQVIEAAEPGGAVGGLPRRPEAGVYAPSFNLWEGSALLDFLFQATATPKPKDELPPLLLLNLLLPKADTTQRPL